MYLDLHNHTTFSDGENSVENIFKLAKEKKVKVVSITDHDNINSIEDFLSNHYDFNGYYVPGCEITACFNGLPIEILAYGFDYKKLKEFINQKSKKENEFADILKAEHLYKIFKSIDPNVKCTKPKLVDKVWNHHFSTWKVFYQALSSELVKKEIIKDCGEEALNTRSVFLRRGINNSKSKFYVDLSGIFPSVEETVEAIHNSDGIAVIAHPLLYTNSFDVLVNIYNQVDGIECFHRSAIGHIKEIVRFAKKHKKIITGGSDCHDNIIRPFNYMKIPFRYFKKIKPYLKNIYKK